MSEKCIPCAFKRLIRWCQLFCSTVSFGDFRRFFKKKYRGETGEEKKEKTGKRRGKEREKKNVMVPDYGRSLASVRLVPIAAWFFVRLFLDRFLTHSEIKKE